MIAESTLWIAIGLITYSYVFYPVLLCMLARRLHDPAVIRPVPDIPPDDWPTVSLVIAAYREESVILDRLRNAERLDYPLDRLEILIGCDGNEDLTGWLVEAYGDDQVRLLQYPERRGKASVLNDAVPEARGEIIVLSDANTMMDRDAVKYLVRHFRNPTIGGVVGRLILTDRVGAGNVDGIYWKYENFLKEREGRMGALLGANGAIYALRRDLWSSIPPHTIVDDFLIGMRVHLAKKRLVYEPDAVAREETALSMRDEFGRRARIGAGGFQSLIWLRSLLNPLRGRVAFAFWSHKVLRWFAPFFMLIALISNALLLPNPVYSWLLMLQLLFYLVAWLGPRFPAPEGIARLLRIPAMFVNMNAALLAGAWRLCNGKQRGTWKRTERNGSRNPVPQNEPETAGKAGAI